MIYLSGGISIKNDIIFIGAVSPPITGPGIKHSFLIQALKDRGYNIKVINLLKSKISFLINLISLFFINEKYIFLGASKKSRIIFIPFLCLVKKISNSRIYLFVAGGRFFIQLNNFPFPFKLLYIKFLNCFSKIYVQSMKEQKEFKKILPNGNIVEYLPNFKFRPKSKPQHIRTDTLRLVYLGRMAKRKGIFDLLDAVNKLIKKNYNLRLDFYGSFMTHDLDEKIFKTKIESYSFIRYHGQLDQHKIQKVLPQYDVFVFPTHHKMEGFPGVILDAFFSALPVIAADWRYRSEIIKNNVNGLYFKAKSVEELTEQIIKLYKDRYLLEEMSENAWSISKIYDVNFIIDKMIIKHLKNS